MGLENTPFGIKITIFDIFQCKEYGIFLNLNEVLWRKINFNEPIKKKKYLHTIPILENYNLRAVMNSFGWKAILDCLQIENSSDVSEIEGIKTFFGITSIFTLEGLLKIQE